MVDDVTTILCTGDIHLGRHPTRIPSERDGPQFSPRTIWQDAIQAAIEAQVSAVVVTGDIVDLENKYFEAYGAFRGGARALSDAGIPLIVVGGNHDYDTLPRMVADLADPNVKLLGMHASWERYTLEVDGEPAVHLDGWSFPTEHFNDSPLETYELDPDPEVPIIGVVHADLDSADSAYAPVAKSDLLATDTSAWLLGHIHKPGMRHENDPVVLYPGSLQPLDPSEPGHHGPWLIHVRPQGHVEAEQLPLATLRYETYKIDATEAEDEKAVPHLVSNHIEGQLTAQTNTGRMELLLPSIVLTGRCPGHGAIARKRDTLLNQLIFPLAGTTVAVETLELDTRPAVELDDLAEGKSPVAWVARLLQDLENDELPDEREGLLESALEAMEDAHAATTYNPLRRGREMEPPGRQAAIELLVDQAWLLLDTLLAQKEGST